MKYLIVHLSLIVATQSLDAQDQHVWLKLSDNKVVVEAIFQRLSGDTLVVVRGGKPLSLYVQDIRQVRLLGISSIQLSSNFLQEVIMKPSIISAGIVIIASVLTLSTDRATAQVKEISQEVLFAERNLGGPRLGVTYVPGNGKLVQRLKQKGIGSFISQFGWHFEYQVIPDGGGPSFVIQAVPFIGGVEYGTLVPSGTLAMGIRLPDGIEFGMGPNIIAGGPKGVTSSLVVAVGKSFNYGGVSIPVNIAFSLNPDGNRVSIIFGYAIAKGIK